MLKSVKKINVKNKKVLLRADFNVPIKNGKITDNSRIKAVMPTIEYLVKNKAKIILISHLGQPKGTKDKKYSLKLIADYLKIKFLDDCLGKKTQKTIQAMKPSQIILLENLRFYPEEEKNDPAFAKKLADLADIYVNDAFSVCHREHSSVSAITKFLPSCAGFLLEKEIKELSKILENPDRPFIAIIGGAKISTKIKVIKNLLKKIDYLLVGGALANNFFKVSGYETGKSLIEEEVLGEAKKILKEKKIVLPIDIVVENKKPKNINEADKNEIILDIGPKTAKLFSNYIKKAKMIVWNGPMGMFEKNGFAQGTKKIAEAVLNNKKAKIIIGGGETIVALKNQKKGKNVFISTGGGAMLKFLEGNVLPGVKPLIK
ncbi:MAG: phosphoglycerate kinase [Parcubacteria group bacterium Athens1014_10]|nr:MAG: phosphoglycerate kinase [Parcubacteria group bacterium Athens1014_10]TSD05132.1 MAG: phosphoglycerate kinase [Parcubacteria group bacterium Athens0714_12]